MCLILHPSLGNGSSLLSPHCSALSVEEEEEEEEEEEQRRGEYLLPTCL